MHPITRSLDASIFIEKKLHFPKSLIVQLKNRKLTSLEFRRARWRHAFSHFNLSPDVDLIDELDTLFFRTAMPFIEINNSVKRLLKKLKAHYHLGIVTNGLYDPRLKISQMGLTKVFSDNKIFHSEQLGYRKPDPKIYLVALNHFTKKPDETLFIGDSWIHDIVGQMEIGMDAIWVNTKGNTRTTSHIPVAIVSDILEIWNILLTN